jgi:hypothetical protein
MSNHWRFQNNLKCRRYQISEVTESPESRRLQNLRNLAGGSGGLGLDLRARDTVSLSRLLLGSVFPTALLDAAPGPWAYQHIVAGAVRVSHVPLGHHIFRVVGSSFRTCVTCPVVADVVAVSRFTLCPLASSGSPYRAVVLSRSQSLIEPTWPTSCSNVFIVTFLYARFNIHTSYLVLILAYCCGLSSYLCVSISLSSAHPLH